MSCVLVDLLCVEEDDVGTNAGAVTDDSDFEGWIGIVVLRGWPSEVRGRGCQYIPWIVFYIP